MHLNSFIASTFNDFEHVFIENICYALKLDRMLTIQCFYQQSSLFRDKFLSTNISFSAD